MSSLHFLQINSNKALLSAVDVASKFDQDNISIALITEPYVAYSKPASLPTNVKAIFSASPRATILARNSLNVTQISHLLSRDMAVALYAPRNQPKILLASVYLDITKPVRQEGLVRILQYARRQDLKLILACDTNAHSPLLGGTDRSNKRGEDLEEVLAEFGLYTENRGDVPTFAAPRGSTLAESFIDGTFTINFDAPLCDWRVCPDYNGSDHRSILFSLPDLAPPAAPSWNWRKIDWKLFRTTLAAFQIHTPDIINKKALDKMVHKLYVGIERAVQASCPKSSTHKKHALRWHGEELHSTSLKLRKAYDLAKRSGSWQAYKTIKSKYKKHVKRREIRVGKNTKREQIPYRISSL